MAITFKALGQVLDFVVDSKKPVMLRGYHGIGKSTLVYDFARNREMDVIERRASQMQEGDLLGLPSVESMKNENVTRWVPPDWLHEACQRPVVLFIDELDRATMEVRQGFFELTDSRKIAGQHLHEGTLIFAAINGGEERNSQYQIGEMDPAELDRWAVFDLEPSVEDWLSWAKDNVTGLIWDFINQNHNHLEHSATGKGGGFEPNKVYPSRRSWHHLSLCLERANLLKPGESDSRVYNIVHSFVGMEAATAFASFVKNQDRQVSVEDILYEGKHHLVKDYTINEHMAIIEKLKTGKYYKGKMSKKVAANWKKYFMMLPGEAAVVMWENFIMISQDTKKEEGIDNYFDFHKELEGYIRKLLYENEEKKNKKEEKKK